MALPLIQQLDICTNVVNHINFQYFPNGDFHLSFQVVDFKEPIYAIVQLTLDCKPSGCYKQMQVSIHPSIDPVKTLLDTYDHLIQSRLYAPDGRDYYETFLASNN